MELSLFNTLTVVNLFIVVLLIIYFQANKTGNLRANRVLSALLFVFLLQILFSFTTSNYAYGRFLQYHKELFMLQKAGLLMGPLMLLYVRLVVYPDLELRWTQVFHYFPFVLISLGTLLIIKDQENFIIWKKEILNRYSIFIILLHNLSYLVTIVIYLSREKISVRTFFSELAQSKVTALLKFFVFGFIMLWFINVYIFASIMVINDTKWCAFTNSIFALTVFALVCSWLILLLFKPEILVVKTKYKYNKMKENEKLVYEMMLEEHLRNNKSYLDSELSLDKLARELNMSSRIISQIINEKYECTFRSYINGFRIEDCVSQLSDPLNSDKTILEIMFDAGFSTKSAFNDAFRKHMGVSPVEYRRQVQTRTLEQVAVC